MKNIFLILLLIGSNIINAQNISVKETYSKTNFPRIIWQTAKPVDTLDFEIFRTHLKNKDFRSVQTLHYIKPSKTSDSLFFTVIDTTLTQKGVYLYYIKALRNGKSVISATAMAHNLGLLNKPQIISFTAEPLTDRKAVRLQWQLNYTETLSSLTLYRSNKYDNGYKKIAELNPEENFFTDVIPLANEPWFYFIELNNYFNGTVRSVRTPAFASFAEKPFPPQDIHSEVINDSITIKWRNAGDNIVGYRVYRSINKRPFTLLREMQQNINKNVSFIDSGKEIKKAIRLRYYFTNISDGFIESHATDTISFNFPEHKPIYPPKQADFVRNDNGNIKLLWIPDNTSTSLAYNVYIKSPQKKITKLNKTVLHQNYYTDSVSRPSGIYEYQIETIGFNNKTSSKRTPVFVNFDSENIDILLNLTKINKGLKISCKNPNNKNTAKILLYKQVEQKTPVLIKTYRPNNDISYTDLNVKRGTHYLYKLIVITKYGKKIDLNNEVEIVY